VAPLRCGFFGAPAELENPEVPDLRGAPLAAPVFGRGADLPKLGIVLIASSFNRHKQARKSKTNALLLLRVSLRSSRTALDPKHSWLSTRAIKR
jgi:hypothetical protein